MRKIISIQTDTATLVIYDLMSLKHRINDDADWWSLPEDEVEEINKGNVLFLNLGDDGNYKVDIKNDIGDELQRKRIKKINFLKKIKKTRINCTRTFYFSVI